MFPPEGVRSVRAPLRGQLSGGSAVTRQLPRGILNNLRLCVQALLFGYFGTHCRMDS